MSSTVLLTKMNKDGSTIDTDQILKKFRSLECKCCQEHFGYQSRFAKEDIFCSAKCMTKGSLRVQVHDREQLTPKVTVPNKLKYTDLPLRPPLTPVKEVEFTNKIRTEAASTPLAPKLEKNELDKVPLVPSKFTLEPAARKPVRENPSEKSSTDSSILSTTEYTPAQGVSNLKPTPSQMAPQLQPKPRNLVERIPRNPSDYKNTIGNFGKGSSSNYEYSAVQEMQNLTPTSMPLQYQPKQRVAVERERIPRDPIDYEDTTGRDRIFNNEYTPVQAMPTPITPKLEGDKIDGIISPKKIFLSESLLSPNIGSMSKVGIIFQFSQTRLLVGSDNDDSAREEMQAAVRDGNFEPYKGVPVVGELVISKYEGENYRAVVATVKDDRVELEFVDYGGTAEPEVKDLLHLDDSTMKYPIYGRFVNLKVRSLAPVVPEEFYKASGGTMTLQFVRPNEKRPSEYDVMLWVTQEHTLNSLLEAIP